MGIEDQKEEREVLDSIFPDEITDISDTSYRISVGLDVETHEDDDLESPTVFLQVSYPENYPDEAPNLDISTPPNTSKHPLLDIQEDKANLLEILQAAVEENMGMAMVFTLVSTLKDSAELLISERQKAAHVLKEAEAAKAEEEENKKFHGTAITRQTFMEWRERFKKEMEEAEQRRREEKESEDKKKRVTKEEKRMTGKELWLSGIAKGDEEEGADDTSQAMEALKV
ncbi:MAG: hypothetical protein M1834_001791 [Cirrosporium novae-zelandiae]|nr:MAG: hypothetical protein M1834_001791 [Cirrosporium novae-zelandiae]